MWAYAPADGAEDPSQFLGTETYTHRGWSEYRFGVFADGGDPFRASGGALTELTGTATYEGGASGVYGRGRTTQAGSAWLVDFFTADATLTVDFSARPGANGEGAATGRIHNMKIGGRPIAAAMTGFPWYLTTAPVVGNPEITLGGGVVYGVDPYAIIESDQRDGHFGTATMTTRISVTDEDGPYPGEHDVIWDGHWEGAFFGNPAPGAAGADRWPGSVAGAFGVERSSAGDRIIGTFAAHRTGWTDAPEGVRQ